MAMAVLRVTPRSPPFLRPPATSGKLLTKAGLRKMALGLRHEGHRSPHGTKTCAELSKSNFNKPGGAHLLGHVHGQGARHPASDGDRPRIKGDLLDEF